MKQRYSIRFVNRLTGDIVDAAYATKGEAKDLYGKVHSMRKSLDKAETKLVAYIIGSEEDELYEPDTVQPAD